MNTYIYKTELDGMKTVATKRKIEENDYVYVVDKLYEDEPTLFKNKRTTNEQADLKLVKLAEISLVPEEEINNYKANQIYNINNAMYKSTNRLNKNQIIMVEGNFFVIKDIMKKDHYMELELEQIPFLEATNLYTVMQREKGSRTEKVYGRYTDFGEAYGNILKMRSEKDNNYYYFP